MDKKIVYHGTRQLDYFDVWQFFNHQQTFIILTGLLAAFVIVLALFVISQSLKNNIEKKVEDEFNEIKETYRIDLDPKSQMLVENQRLQNVKDVFQTVSQGQAALWKPKEV